MCDRTMNPYFVIAVGIKANRLRYCNQALQTRLFVIIIGIYKVITIFAINCNHIYNICIF